MSNNLLNDLLRKEPVSSQQEEAFKFQLELLKTEIDLVERSIERDESRAQNVKNFAIAAWGTSIALFVGQGDLRKFAIFTVLIPLLFWLVDAWWTKLRMGVHVRAQKIRDFVNSPNLIESFRKQKFVDFTLLDISGSQYKEDAIFIRYSRLSRIMRFKEMLYFYGGLIVFSLLLGALLFII